MADASVKRICCVMTALIAWRSCTFVQLGVFTLNGTGAVSESADTTLAGDASSVLKLASVNSPLDGTLKVAFVEVGVESAPVPKVDCMDGNDDVKEL